MYKYMSVYIYICMYIYVCDPGPGLASMPRSRPPSASRPAWTWGCLGFG